MKLNKCKLNYDILSQLRDQFIQNIRLKQIIFDHLFNTYNDKFVTTLLHFINEDYIQETLKWTFRNLLIEEFKQVLARNGSDLTDFLKFIKNGDESTIISYEKMIDISNQFAGIRVDDQKWQSSVVLNIKIQFKAMRINGTDIIKFFSEV